MKRRIVQTVIVAATVMVVGGGAALAKDITCGGGECVGTKKADEIAGSTNPDVIFGKGGADWITQPDKLSDGDDDEIDGGNGDDRIFDYAAATDNDVIYGGKGDDWIATLEGQGGGKDTVDCGEGDDDYAWVDQNDVVVNCEWVSFEAPNF